MEVLKTSRPTTPPTSSIETSTTKGSRGAIGAGSGAGTAVRRVWVSVARSGLRTGGCGAAAMLIWLLQGLTWLSCLLGWFGA